MEKNTFKLPDSLFNRIKTLADKIGLTPDEIVALSIESYLVQNGIEPPRGWIDSKKSPDTTAIRDLRRQGYSLRQIAKLTNVAHTTVHKILKDLNES